MHLLSSSRHYFRNVSFIVKLLLEFMKTLFLSLEFKCLSFLFNCFVWIVVVVFHRRVSVDVNHNGMDRDKIKYPIKSNLNRTFYIITNPNTTYCIMTNSIVTCFYIKRPLHLCPFGFIKKIERSVKNTSNFILFFIPNLLRA